MRQATGHPSVDEEQFLVQTFMGMTNNQVRDFLRNSGLQVSGTKAELRERIEEALEGEELGSDDLLEYLDEVSPWWKQHVFILDGPEDVPTEWTTAARAEAKLGQHGLDGLLNAYLPLLLPSGLTVSAVEYEEGDFLRVFAVSRRDYTMRDPDLDEEREDVDGHSVELRAFVQLVTRGLVVFEWHFPSGQAELRITELPSGTTYEEVLAEFWELVAPWLDQTLFAVKPLHNAVSQLHIDEEQGQAETRGHRIDYRTPQGRRLSGRSGTASMSVLGEDAIDDALRNVRDIGIAHLGNFYWLTATESPAHGNPLEKEVHTYIVANKSRVHFSKNYDEESVRHVLSRVRDLSA